MEEKSISVSVVIPTYNRSRYVTKAIDSVLAQTYKDYEIIVVDDGSTDNTKDVLQPYMDQIRYIYQENTGVSAARNTCISAAKGEWVAFLDSDDEWLPDKLCRHIKCLEENKDVCLHTANAGVVGFLPNGKRTTLFEMCGFWKAGVDYGIVKRPDNLELQMRYGFARLCTMAVRREVFLKAGMLDTRLTIYEDQDMLLRLALCGSWAVSDEELMVIYRQREEQSNLSQHRVAQPINSGRLSVHIYDKLSRDSRLTPYEKRLIDAKLRSCEAALGMELLKAGRSSQARVIFRRLVGTKMSAGMFVRYLISLMPSAVSARLIKSWHRVRLCY